MSENETERGPSPRGRPITVESVSHSYAGRAGEIQALRDIDLEIEAGEVFSLVGPSGCGKSTLLQLIAGLEEPVSGRVLVGGEPVRGPGPDRGVVFQQYALFPWMTVRGNVEFGLRLQGMDRKRRRDEARVYIDLVGLGPFADSYPRELSGGMKQRAALARAYAVRPGVLLMDEPFGALDSQTRGALQEELLKTWETERATVFFITHDVDEAIFLAQRVAVMTARPGRIREIVEIGFPFPRRQELKLDAEFARVKKRIWKAVHEEHLAAEG